MPGVSTIILAECSQVVLRFGKFLRLKDPVDYLGHHGFFQASPLAAL